MVQACLGINMRPYLKNNYSQKKWGGAGSVAQVAKHLPSKIKALSSNPRTAKQQQQK
jgi:hypothetical protein